MELDSYKLQIVLILTVGLGLASLLGYLTYRLRLSPILGYLLAGYLIGPYSPGFVADSETAEKLAEIGVILMMFGVGLNFKIEELISVKNIAIPGAFLQTLFTALITTWLVTLAGWPFETGLLMGLGIGVASTVVLVRMLEDNNLFKSQEGHIAIGWTIVEDMITVGLLILIPDMLPILRGESGSLMSSVGSIVLMLLKVLFLAIGMFTVGQKIVTAALSKISSTQSHELFTVTILAMTFLIATGSSFFFGTSIALGSFIAGMVIGQTNLRQQAATHSMAIKDAFVVIFFLSVGMIFNPMAMIEHPLLFLSTLSAVLLIKPLIASALLLLFKYPKHTALIVGIALAQIGEFSFILSEEALKYKLIPDESYDVIVASALISIGINPILFKLLGKQKT
jgi:CPA2 family monovalent cation:H+ antiporter-2